MKTPEQIGRQVIDNHYGIGTDWEEPNQFGEEGFTRAQAESDIDADDVRLLIEEGIEADRAQIASALQGTTAVPQGFWPQIDHQLDRIRRERPETFEAVRTILLDPAYDEIVAEVNRNFPRTFSAEAAFFAGGGGEDTLRAALVIAGWRVRSSAAWYHYALTHPITGETLAYIEGDVGRSG